MKLTRPFAMVEKDVLFSPEMTALEKLVYCVLCAFSDNNTRSCYPSYNTIAEKVGCSKKTAIQCVASLCEKGWMQKMEQRTKKGGHRSNMYFLVLSPEKQYLYPSHTKPESPSQSEKSDSSSDGEPYWGYTERLMLKIELNIITLRNICQISFIWWISFASVSQSFMILLSLKTENC